MTQRYLQEIQLTDDPNENQRRMLAELSFMTPLAERMGHLMRHRFAEMDPGLEEKIGSSVTRTDRQINAEVLEAFAARGEVVVGEEGGTAEYGTRDAYYLDPIDGTDDFIHGRKRRPSLSLAMFSLARVAQGRPVVGVALAPLLPEVRMYTAIEGMGAVRIDADGEQTSVAVSDATNGIVLVSENSYPYTERIKEKGFTAIPLGGSVFKSCCVADPELIGAFDPKYVLTGQEVIGYVSSTAWAHDYAAAAIIAREAGAIVTGKDGGKLKLDYVMNGCVFANNELTHAQLVDAMRE